MKTDLMIAIGQVFRRRWTLPILVAGAWTAIVTLYILVGLRPHGYIGDETEALWTWLGWMAGGGKTSLTFTPSKALTSSRIS